MKTIVTLRREAGMTQLELAVKLETSVTSVASWEQGKYDPSARQLRRMAALFGVRCEDIDLPSDHKENHRPPD